MDPLVDIRKDFPIFSAVGSPDRPFCYLDNAATTQKPGAVIDAIQAFYTASNANVGRGIYTLGHEATRMYATTRQEVAAFIGAKAEEIVFTRSATESINLVAGSYLAPRLEKGDNVVVTQMEHHANFIPWQQLCLQAGAAFRVVPVLENGDVDLQKFEESLDERTALTAFTHISNTLGTINPVRQMVSMAHAKGIPVLVDGAQAILSEAVNVRDLDVDFYCFSAHKMFGPTGLGVLFGRHDILEDMPPYQTGGGMIRTVSNEETVFAPVPARFEAGTPHMAGVAGLGAAIRYIGHLGQGRIHAHICALNASCRERLREMNGIRLLAGGGVNAGITSFVCAHAHPHDVATVLDQYGVAVRAGHHCTEPLMQSMNLHGTVRVSFSIYNEAWEIDQLLKGLKKVKEIFG